MKITLLLLVVTLSEATIGVFVKLTGDAIPIYTLNFYALSFAAVFLFVSLPPATGQKLRIPRGNIRDTLIIGALIALQISVFNFAMTMAPIANVVIFWSVAPFFTFMFSALFLGEKARKSYIFIFIIALAGIFIAKPLQGGHMVGNLVALGDGAIYAAMVTYLRSEGKTETNNDIFWFMAIAAVYLSPSLLISGPGNIMQLFEYQMLDITVPALVWAACLGIISTGLAYLCISIVLQQIDANIYSLIDIIVSPVVASLLGYMIFSEIPSPNMIYGGALLLGAGFWLSYEMSKGGQRWVCHPCQYRGMPVHISGHTH